MSARRISSCNISKVRREKQVDFAALKSAANGALKDNAHRLAAARRERSWKTSGARKERRTSLGTFAEPNDFGPVGNALSASRPLSRPAESAGVGSYGREAGILLMRGAGRERASGSLSRLGPSSHSLSKAFGSCRPKRKFQQDAR